MDQRRQLFQKDRLLREEVRMIKNEVALELGLTVAKFNTETNYFNVHQIILLDDEKEANDLLQINHLSYSGMNPSSKKSLKTTPKMNQLLGTINSILKNHTTVSTLQPSLP